MANEHDHIDNPRNQVDYRVLSDCSLPTPTKTVYAFLAARATGEWSPLPPPVKLAHYLGYQTSTITNAVKSARQAGLISVEKDESAARGAYPHRYRVHDFGTGYKPGSGTRVCDEKKQMYRRPPANLQEREARLRERYAAKGEEVPAEVLESLKEKEVARVARRAELDEARKKAGKPTFAEMEQQMRRKWRERSAKKVPRLRPIQEGDPACWAWAPFERNVEVDAQKALRMLWAWHKRRCGICGELQSYLVVDHDHNTALVRGLLCDDCNLAEGRARDPEDVFARWRAVPPAAMLRLRFVYTSPIAGVAAPLPFKSTGPVFLPEWAPPHHGWTRAVTADVSNVLAVEPLRKPRRPVVVPKQVDA